MIRRLLVSTTGFLVFVAACASPQGEAASATPEVAVPAGECPVTEVSKPGFIAPTPEAAIYTENFPTPSSYPNEYPEPDAVWYGSEGLWTVLSLNGKGDERKTVFWSTNFSGGTVEEQPDLQVTWSRLDGGEQVTVANDRATNAYTPEHGWFMITSPTEKLPAGCWQVEATYKGSTLTYVYEKG